MIPPELQTDSFRPYMASSSFSNSRSRPSPISHNAWNHKSPIHRSHNTNTNNNNWTHNYRIAVALLPCAAILLDIGGTPVISTLIVGLIISYILDSINLNSPSFISLLLTLVFSQFAFFFSSFSFLRSSFNNSLFLTLLSSFLFSHITFLIAIWSSLQFKSFQLQNPQSLMLSLERLLFATLPISATCLLTYASISALGFSTSSSYYLLFFNCLFYFLYSIPRYSSFKTDSFILGELESCFHTLCLVFLPLIFHIATHHSTIFSSASSVADLFLLFFIPFLFQLYTSTRGSLWWVSKNDAHLHSIRVVNGSVALFVVVVCLEIRVVFHSFSRYIHLPPPLNYLLVTFTMLGSCAGAASYALGMVSDSFTSLTFTLLGVLVSASASIVVGFPLLFLPLPCVAGFYLTRFFTKKSLPSYFGFVVIGSLMVMWFVMHHFWDLNIWIAGMSLKSFCKLITANVILAMVVPGLAILPSKFHFVTEIGLIAHALLLCHIENRFFNYSGIYYYGFEDDVMYPSYMVVLTTIVGLALTRRLSMDRRIGPKAVWILTCLYSSKLAMLFISSKSVVWVSALLLLSVSPPLLLYRDKSRMASKMKPWQGYTHAGVVALSVWFCRETIFEALQWWNGRAPSDGLLLGFCIVLTGLACLPIVALHFSHNLSAKRCLVLIIATGLLFILMQPPIPLSWTYRSDLIKAARQSADDISIYGFVAPKPTWPAWLLIVAILLTLAALTSIIPIKYMVELRVLYSIAMGIALGVYISAEYFLQAAFLHALIVVAVVCTSVFVVFTHFPSASSVKLLPCLFALLVALFPVTYLLEGQVRIRSIFEDGGAGEMGEEEKKLTTILAVEGARASLLGLYAAIFMVISLVVKFELASLMHEKAVEKGGVSHIQPRNPPRMRFVQQGRTAGGSKFTIKKMASVGAWMPAVGNVATILCFAICLILNVNLTGGSNQAIFFLAPILLLLNQDSDFVAGFGDKQRYFPVTIVISVYLVVTALYSIWEDVWHGNAGWGIEIGGPDWFFAVKNLALLMLTFPSHILFNRFVWSYTKQKDSSAPLITLPLNLPSVIITDVLKVRILGLLGIVYSLAQYLISRQQYLSGLRYI